MCWKLRRSSENHPPSVASSSFDTPPRLGGWSLQECVLRRIIWKPLLRTPSENPLSLQSPQQDTGPRRTLLRSILQSVWEHFSAKPKGISKRMAFKMASFLIHFKGAQTVKCKPWTERVAEKGLSRGVSRGAWKRRLNRELEAKKAHKPWIREGLNREVQTVN